MWDPAMQRPKLCDFDLAYPCKKTRLVVEEVGPSGPTGLSKNRTWIFTAKELLSDAAMAGEVKCVYRHDVEAFVAVLVWIVCRYQDGKVKANSPLEHWIQRSHLECRKKRGRTFDQIAMGEFHNLPVFRRRYGSASA
ncbi:hypothetical protein FA13DRAFT_1738790 [Coprinellus micaceus]|uniref:Fungal-type protein kinase domain-containing protein n=1 Tax=Coprinellus micaceus TaxID=71717 RepID=A0A4Y7STK1_COPMI|nr:hypothetical protein FA13DRAFT_1738790 [Coprinellus micaceus]